MLLAGDAAHVHSPVGGQGLNTGVQDAVNLGWKLAQVVKGTSPESLLDTYHAERHPVAARVLRNTMAQVALMRLDDRIEAVRDIVSELLSMDEPRKRFAARMSGLDIHYDLGEGHPLLGRRMPDLDLVTANGPLRVYTLLHDARPVLLNFGEPGGFDIAPVGGSRSVDRRQVRWHVGASGDRGGHCSHRRADSARRICGLGGRPDSARARRRADHLVRTACITNAFGSALRLVSNHANNFARCIASSANGDHSSRIESNPPHAIPVGQHCRRRVQIHPGDVDSIERDHASKVTNFSYTRLAASHSFFVVQCNIDANGLGTGQHEAGAPNEKIDCRARISRNRFICVEIGVPP